MLMNSKERRGLVDRALAAIHLEYACGKICPESPPSRPGESQALILECCRFHIPASFNPSGLKNRGAWMAASEQESRTSWWKKDFYHYCAKDYRWSGPLTLSGLELWSLCFRERLANWESRSLLVLRRCLEEVSFCCCCCCCCCCWWWYKARNRPISRSRTSCSTVKSKSFEVPKKGT